MTETSRRVLLTGAAGVGVAAAVAACSGGGDGGAGPYGGSADRQAPPAGSATGGAQTRGGGAGGALATKAEIPVGGGKIFPSENAIITQPTAGTFKAFEATCTHMGCTLAAVTDGVIMCGCHGSRFSAADGSVRSGPATRPLPERKITIEGDSISLA